MDTAEVEEEEWVEYIERSAKYAENKMRTANIQCWIETQRKMKWRLAIVSHPEERWTKKRQNGIQVSALKQKTSSSVGRPKKIWEDDINLFVKPEETEETRGSDLKNNDTWLK